MTETSQRPMLVNPKKAEACQAATIEQLLDSAHRWVSAGAPGLAVDLWRLVLVRDPKNGQALRQLALWTEAQDVDQAHSLFRRADAVGAMHSDDYVEWIRRLLMADPQRKQQATDVAQLFLARTGGDTSAGAKAAWCLAFLGRLEPAAEALLALYDREDLTAAAADDLVGVVRLVLESRGKWSHFIGQVLRVLTKAGSQRACMESVRLAVRHGQFGDALGFLNQCEKLENKDAPEAVAALAWESKYWRALIAVASDDHERAVPLLRELVREKDSPVGMPEAGSLDLELARSLLEIGQFEEATAILRRLKLLTDDGASGSSGARLSGTETADSEVTTSEAETINGPNGNLTSISAMLLHAMVKYDSGDFSGLWGDASEVCKKWTDEALPVTMRVALLSLKCQLEVQHAGWILAEMETLRDPGGWDTSDGIAIETARLETLSWLSGHAEGYGQVAENALHDALAVLKDKPSDGLLAHKRAYVALLAHDYALARKLLVGEEKSLSWRVLAMQAHAALGLRDGRGAFDFCSRLKTHRPHDLRVRCMYIEAALMAGESTRALREAEALVKFAPEHVIAHLLLAECLESDNSRVKPDPELSFHESPGQIRHHLNTVRTNHARKFQDCIYAARHYAAAIRLDQDLVSALSSKNFSSQLASDPLSRDAVEQAARKGAHAAMQAAIVMAKSGLPRDRRLLSDGRALIARLSDFDPEEAKRLAHILRRPRRERFRRQFTRRGLPVLGLLSLLALIVLDTTLPAFDNVGAEARVLVFALAGLAVVWPHAQKLNLPGGIGLERAAPEQAVEIDSTLVANGLISAQSWLRDSMAPTAPPEIVPGEESRSFDAPIPAATAGAGVDDEKRAAKAGAEEVRRAEPRSRR